MLAFINKVIDTGARWGAKNGLTILRISLSIIFFWFGFLKFFPGLSTAEDIASRTILWITCGTMHRSISMPMLGTLECLIGLFLFLRIFIPLTLILLYFQMIGACLPLIIFPHETWSHFFVPSLLGQYIIKNCVLISAAIVLGATMKGGGLVAQPFYKGWFSNRKKTAESNIS